jgi:hypothetical protein
MAIADAPTTTSTKPPTMAAASMDALLGGITRWSPT